MFLQNTDNTLWVTQILKYGMYRKAQSTKLEFWKDLQCLIDSNTEAEKKDILQNSHRKAVK